MCGKTGTAQNTHGKDNSVFVAFAPRENPKIAIAVVVEKSGQGATWAAPIASFIIEKYLTGAISSRPSGIAPDYYINKNLLPEISQASLNLKHRSDSLKKVKKDSVKRTDLKTAAKKQQDNKVVAMLPAKRKGNE